MTRAKGPAPFVALAIAGIAAGAWLWFSTGLSQLPLDSRNPRDWAATTRSPESMPAGSRAALPADLGVESPKLLRLRLLDAESLEQLGEVRLCDGRDGKILATTASDGAAELAASGVHTLLIARPGYLLRLFDPKPDPGAVQDVLLQRDRFTIPREFRFQTSTGAPAQALTFVITCRDEHPWLGGSVPGVEPGGAGASTALRSAWQQHQMLAVTPRFVGLLDQHVHFGLQSDHTRFTSEARTTVHFCAAGRYAIEAVSAAGEAATLEFSVAKGNDQPLDVRLQAGLYIRGTVVGSDGTPIAGVTISDVSEDRGHALPLVLGATDIQGEFRCGPLADTVLPLTFTGAEYEPGRIEATRPGGEPLRIVLVKRPARVVLGIVRGRPHLEVIDGAKVRLEDSSGNVLVRGTTDVQGLFTVQSSALDLALVIEAEGKVPYKEIVEPDGSRLAFDLLPDREQARVAAGLTGTLEGRVLDAAGQPVPNAPVILLFEEPHARVGVPGRRILRGGVLDLPLRTTTGSDGTFVLESDLAGAARLVLGGARSEDGIPVTITLGTRLPPVTLRAPR